VSAAWAAPRSANGVICDEALAERVFDLAIRLADELADPDATEAADLLYLNTSARISSRGLGGSSGMALFFAAVAQATNEPRHHAALHAYMKRAAQADTTPSTGLFSGLDGLLAASSYAIFAEPRYGALSKRCADTLSQLDKNIFGPFEPAAVMYDYDLIGGSAGKALASSVICEKDAAHTDRLRRMCDHLAWLLADPIRWKCPHPRILTGFSWNDLGMAHGVAGMIATLSLVAPEEKRYLQAINAGCQFLIENRYPGERLDWPASVSGDERLPSRSGWCYGSPGCAAALILGAGRLGNKHYETMGLKALHDVCTSPIEEWRISDYALCHGFAGNAILFLRIGLYTGDSLVLSSGIRLLDRILDAYDPAIPFGYRPENRESPPSTLLTGAAGIALTLLTAAGYCNPSWTRYFGLP
jgi:lantibiotic modifying enzyme